MKFDVLHMQAQKVGCNVRLKQLDIHEEVVAKQEA